MNYKIVLNFFFAIIAIVVGAALFKLFDFQNLKIENPGLALVYSIVFVAGIVFMNKKSKKK